MNGTHHGQIFSPDCPLNSIQMNKATWAIKVGIKKYSLRDLLWTKTYGLDIINDHHVNSEMNKKL